MASNRREYGWGAGLPAPLPPSLPEPMTPTLVRLTSRPWADAAAVLLAYVALACVSRAPYGCLTASLLLIATLASVVVPISRRWWGRLLHARRVRWRWMRATRAAVMRHHLGRPPAIYRVRRTRAGDVLRVRVPVGSHVRDLEIAADVLAVVLQVREVRVSPVRDNAAFADVALVRRDPLEEATSRWPGCDLPSHSLWTSVPVGVDADGNNVRVHLPEHNVLIGGEPGAGKSVAMSQLVATAALDPLVQLHLFDGKLVELAPWARCASSSVGTDVSEAIRVLQQLRREMDDRYLALLAKRERKVTVDSGLALHVLVFDELAHYLSSQDRRERAEFADLLRDLVSRGRAAGFIVLAATQKPSHDIIPTYIRDLFGFRWALRCNTPQASDTVLGAGWASAGCSATDIDAAQRGVGYLLHEGERPVRFRSFQLSDEDITVLARRAEQVRCAAEHATVPEVV